MVFTAYFYICAQRLCDINANRSPLLFLSMINLTVFEGAQYPTLSFGEICVLPLALLLKSHCKTSAGFQQTLKILKILNMEKSDTLRWPSAQPKGLVKCDLDQSSAKVWVYSKPKVSPPSQEEVQRLHCSLRHLASHPREISPTAFSGWKATALPHFRLPGQKRLEKWNKNMESQETRPLLFGAHFTSLWPAPIWYSTILQKQ